MSDSAADPKSDAGEGRTQDSPDSIEEAIAADLTDGIPPRGNGTLPMVGLGGSAGSIGALQEFFSAMPADSGMVFVVILHLSPDHESRLAEMFQRSTAMRVFTAEDGIRAESNCIYVIPPGKHLSAFDGKLRLTNAEHSIGRRVAVDFFFRSLADSHGQQSVAIVLSGADGDGAIGIKRVKERGGLTIAQDPDEAQHSGMPLAAIATGMVDWVLKVSEIPARLRAYRDRGERLNLPDDEGPHPAQADPKVANEGEAALRDILVFLHMRTGCNFSYYKRATILRRVARRIQVNGLDDLAGYLLHLRTHTGEAGALLQDLLISVTNFFRDRDAFESLADVLPKLFKGKGPSDTVRVWAAACATGEEAYSLAIMLCEHARTLEAPPQLQVFATDLDDEAIRVAREGFYPEAISADVNEERLRRFFVHEKNGYRVRREVREIVLFAPHDLLNDSPFSRLDLVSCRNLLIYLNRDAQERALEVFHFALRPGGRLFLGLSESVDEESLFFTAENKKHRIYLQRPGRRKVLDATLGAGTLARALDLQSRTRERSVVPRASVSENGASGPSDLIAPTPFLSELSASEQHYRIIERLSPPSILINAAHEIVHLSENAGRFLQFPGGEPTRNLLRAVHPMLRIDLRAALYSATHTRQPAAALGVPFETADGPSVVDLRVSCADDLASDLLLVVFTERPSSPDLSARDTAKNVGTDVARHLEQALETTKVQLRETIEQSEASTEELKASNEELQAMNEELRSATEELETSREELHSVNEELTGVNHELTGKVDELAIANSDLQNLMAATAIATVFLDRELRIMRYTPSAIELFNLIPTDIGRRLGDLASKLDYPEIVADATQALEHLTAAQREVKANGQHFLARTFPYRSTDNRIAGVVLTFLDVTKLKEGEDDLRRSEERFRAMIDAIPQLAWVARPDGFIYWYNRHWYDFTGTTPESMLGWGWQSVHDPKQIPEVLARWNESIRSGNRFEMIFPLRGADGKFRTFLTRVEPLRDSSGKVTQWFGTNTDVEELKLSEAALRAAKVTAELANQSKDHFLAVLSHELRTPLTPVLMTVSALESDPDIRDDVREDLAMIKRNIELEKKLIDDLLDLSRITSGKVELVPETIDLNQVVRNVCAICRPELTERKINLETVLSETVGLVRADPARLQQVLWNVLKNAVKFTATGGSVRVSTARLGSDRCEIRIRDNGIGISAEVLPRIFDAFEQGEAHINRQFGGLGLGLAISRALVELQGGSIRAESAGPGTGATFVIELPGANSGQASADPFNSRQAENVFAPLRLLLVEDHADTVHTLSRLLRAAGYIVTTALDIAGAKKAAENQSFDVIISDVGLPDGNGNDLMRSIRASRNIPGIAMSGYGMEDDISRSKAAGFVEHLVKPITIAKLLGAIKRVSANRS